MSALMLLPPQITRRQRRLLARIHRKFHTVYEEIRVGELSIPFTRIADPNRVLDDIVLEEDRREKTTGVRLDDPPHLPYWAELWDSALGLATALLKMPIGPTTRVLDLGCGMGLAGAVAAAMGARVTLADLETPALLFARLNSLPFDSRVRKINWQIDRLGESFDLILGADILYDCSQWEFLNEFWKAHLSTGGSILLAEPGRPTGELFQPWIAAHGWMLRHGVERPPQIKKQIRIYRLMRD
jgi:predicted nicotinamide N-methyase